MPIKLVSLGSSYAAGPSIPPVIHATARRSGANYAHLLAARIDADLVDLSVSGATLASILSEPQVRRNETFPPQIEGVPDDADIILVLGGGNDLGYITGIFNDSVNGRWFTKLLWKVVRFFVKLPVPSVDEQSLVVRYGKTLDALHRRAPKAQVVVVEYLTLLGPDVKARDVTFSLEKVDHHRNAAAALQRATATAADQRADWCTRVSVSGESEGHGLGSKEPWVNGYSFGLLWRIGEGILHPNAEGMRAVAEMVYQRIRDLPQLAGR